MHHDCIVFVERLQKVAHCQWAPKHLKSKAADQAVWGRHVFDFHICIEVDVLQDDHSSKSLEVLATAACMSMPCRASIRLLNAPSPLALPLPHPECRDSV